MGGISPSHNGLKCRLSEERDKGAAHAAKDERLGDMEPEFREEWHRGVEEDENATGMKPQMK